MRTKGDKKKKTENRLEDRTGCPDWRSSVFFVHFCTNAERKTAIRMEGASDEVPAAVA